MGRTEIGEVALTGLIVLIFLGTFLAVGSLPTSSNYLAISPGTLSPSIFTTDCGNLGGASITVINDILSMYVVSDEVSFVSSLQLSAKDNNYGFLVQPYRGYGFVLIPIFDLMNILYFMFVIPLAGAAILAIFFKIAPLFLYLGIVFRTLPFSRAAGGAFLGFFIAFYVLFPLMLYLLLGQVSLTSIQFSSYSTQSLLGSVSPSSNFWVPQSNLIGLNVIEELIGTVVGQMFYIVVAFLLSLILSFDFMEAVGDLLGSPSLSSQHTLRKLI